MSQTNWGQSQWGQGADNVPAPGVTPSPPATTAAPTGTLRRLAYPFQISNGQLALIGDQQAANQAIRALFTVRPGELPLSRDFGVNLDYHIPLDLARLYEGEIRSAIAKWHPELRVRSLRPISGPDGTLLDWNVEIEVQEV